MNEYKHQLVYEYNNEYFQGILLILKLIELNLS